MVVVAAVVVVVVVVVMAIVVAVVVGFMHGHMRTRVMNLRSQSGKYLTFSGLV